MYRLSYERRGDISFIARGTISYFVTSERSERGTKYDIVTRAIKLILPSLECDNLFITYLCFYLGQKSDYIFTLFILSVHFGMNAKLLFKIRQTGRNYKNKQKITYLLIAANFFLLFSLYYCIFCCCLSIDPSVGRHLCFERDKKRYRGTKNDIAGQKTISRDKKRYRGTYRFYVTVLSP